MSWLSDIFSPKKQVAPALKQLPTLSSTEEYPLYRSTLEDRIAGRGLGYDQSVLNSATAPYATQQRQNFANYTAPAISGAASARGLGRSTIPVNQIGLGSQNVESDIANRVAQLTLENEQEKASEKTGAIGAYGGLMGEDYNSLLNNVNSQNAQAIAAADAQNKNNQLANANAQRAAGAITGAAEAGIGAATGNPMMIQGGMGNILGGGNQGSVNSNMGLNDYLSLLNRGGTSAGVNILGGGDSGVFLRNLGQGRLPTQIGDYTGYRTS